MVLRNKLRKAKAAQQMMGFLESPITQQHSGQLFYSNICCGFSSMQGWRKTMEDSHIIEIQHMSQNGPLSLFAIFDGHGGDQVAEYCRIHYLEIMLSTQSFKEKNYQNALIETNYLIDTQLRDETTNIELKNLGCIESKINIGLYGHLVANGIGCTAIVVLIINNTIYCSNVGDSRCILFKNDTIFPLSTNHKPTLPKELSRITQAGGFVLNERVNGNLNLTRSIGDLMFKNQPQLSFKNQIVTCFPDISIQLYDKSPQLLILACDGVWDVLTNEECVRKVLYYLHQRYTYQQISESILSDCVSKVPNSLVGCDNLTIIIVGIN
ncbi:protein phosphatase 2C, putative [Entamoeba dispar SAW760]|uniref:Protein phosphatase 2C, putative n=1 Tax=Entamoeba dispar (strain ATCC PRA-260 / SAW760) TaxID=370354 RepID=B0ED75_ENTDS|nr:protein phosphatase 2C, putative [Entamoeba dispar SAW760]EDR27492.1 protein phosphatase 2C, putative [Entamoeba dispar SAW760]|eukprot:EDR27492.1 protein phosphatase 2C, putative [Entamoeba dispar SAW760]